jgi:hypothetical protein
MILHVKEPGVNPAKALPYEQVRGEQRRKSRPFAFHPSPLVPVAFPREGRTLPCPDGLLLCRPSRKLDICER